MPLPRPLLLALAGVLLLSVAFGVTHNMGKHGSSGPSATTTHTRPSGSAARTHASARPEAHRRAVPKTDVTKPVRRTPARRHGIPHGIAARGGAPARMAQAMARGRMVVLFLFQPGGGDDLQVAHSVAALRGERGDAVLSDDIRHIGRYGAMVGDLGISEAPAIVILDARRRAHVIEGYIDPETLAQEVADIRR